ncbi:MAG: hypothetical protein NTX82_04450 [Candidatus Parcubacteria bacterium]|nr:hypothetical protein [Candidatus Parcubacteria bacterium]
MKNGFTKIEVLIFILLIVMVVAMDVAVIWYLSLKNKDIQVFSEIDQIKSGLEVYLLKNNFYPESNGIINLSDSYSGTEKLCGDGFKKITDNCSQNILKPIPNQYLAEGNIYRYKRSDDGQNYQLEFNLVSNFKNLGLKKGKNCANNIQIISQPCF